MSLAFKPPSTLGLPPPPLQMNATLCALKTINVGRYLGIAGLVVVLYDHVLTFGDEVRLIWAAPRSFPKWMFLVNRYLTELCLLAVANEMSGLNSRPYDDKSCQILIPLVSAYAVFSTLTSNLLAFLRVIVLWEKSPRVVVGLSIIFVLSFLVSLGCTIATIVILLPNVKYNSLARLCYVTKTAPSFIALWSAPMGFEFAVLALTVYNALSRPRSSRDPLARILYRGGMLFFLCVTVIRGVNIAFTTITEPGLFALPLFFNWAMGTVAISRMLIHVRSSENGTQEEEEKDKPTVMPLTLRMSSETGSARRSSAGHVSSIELHSFWASEPITTSGVPVSLRISNFSGDHRKFLH